MFNPLLFKLIGVAVLLGSVFLAGYNTAHKFDTAALAKAQAAAQQQYDAKDTAYNTIANNYEKWKANNAPTIVTRNKLVTQIVKTPIYLNLCLDSSGLSVANNALTRQPSVASQPDTTVPAVDTTK